MRRLIVFGEPGIRMDAVIEYGGEQYHVFQVNRNGEWHGPDEVQLWCVVGKEDEYEDYQKRNFIPHFLEVDRVDAEDLDVIKAKGDLAI